MSCSIFLVMKYCKLVKFDEKQRGNAYIFFYICLNRLLYVSVVCELTQNNKMILLFSL